MNPSIENNFRYYASQPGDPRDYECIRNKAKELAYLIDSIGPDGREKSLAMTNLQQAVMWANAFLAKQSSNCPAKIQQAEYRCCLKAGMTHQAALEHMRRTYPTFTPEAA